MNKQKVFVPNYIPERALHRLQAQFDVVYRNAETSPSVKELWDGLQDADGMVCYSRIKIDANLLDHAPRLRAISNIAVGYDNFAIAEMNMRHIIGTNTPGVLTETTADFAFGILLAAARRIPEADTYVKTQQWEDWSPNLLVGRDVFGSTLGIVGMGQIGQAVARRAKGFDMPILYFNRHRNVDAERTLGATYAPLAQLLGQSDYVMLLTPLSPETTKLIGQTEFAAMKRSAIFINMSRGNTVDEAALISALQQGLIAGAALDVYVDEPLALNSPLLGMHNVVTTPHIGSATIRTREKMAELAVENITAALNGNKPPNLVNPGFDSTLWT